MRHFCLVRRPVHVIEPLESRIAPATFIVNLNGDNPDANPGDGIADTDVNTPGLQTSLRAAIMEANAHPNVGGPDIISFAGIPASGAFVIHPVSELPAITDAVIIDGYTAPGASANTASLGTNAVLRVVIDGSQISGSASGLILGDVNGDPDTSGGSTVRGLDIVNFLPGGSSDSGYGILIQSNANHLEGNFIGTDVTGTSIHGNSIAGIGVDGGDALTGNVIGGATLDTHNLISGNSLGVWLHTASNGTVVTGNLIGTDATGVNPLGNTTDGLHVSGTNDVIGGTSSALGNVISGNKGAGLAIDGFGTTVTGNLIGVGADGVTAVGNQMGGVRVDNNGFGVFIGDSTGHGNVIAGNGGPGVILGSNSGNGPANFVEVEGNFIGTNTSKTMPLGNLGPGIAVYGSQGSAIGEMAPNVIAFNQGAGISLSTEAGDTHVVVSKNSYFGNTGLSIDLHGGKENSFGVTANDPFDQDDGPNSLTNAPTVSVLSHNGTSLSLSGVINARPGITYTIEFYANPSGDIGLSGTGDGTQYLGSETVTTDSHGVATAIFSGTFTLGADTTFTATATDLNTEDTSEFSLAAGHTPVTYTWTGTQSTDWFTPQNWSPNGVPGAFDTAVLPSGTPHGIVLDVAASVSAFQQSGSSFGGAGHLYVRDNLTWTGGSHDGGDLTLSDTATGSINGSAPLTWSAGALDDFGALVVSGAGVSFAKGTFTVETSASLTLNAGLTHTVGAGTPTDFENFGQVDKLGTGTFGLDLEIVHNSNTINSKQGTLILGAYTQTDGFLNLSGGDVSAPAGLSILNGTLQGTGTITGNVTNDGGFIDPAGLGADGKITIQGNYTQTGAGTLLADISGTTAGVSYDQLAVSGTVALAGVLNVTVKPGFVPALGDIYTVLTAGTKTGSFQFLVSSGLLNQNSTATSEQLTRTGQMITWDAGGGVNTDWFTAANWSGDTVPTSGDVAVLNTNATITLSSSDATVGDFIQSNGTLTGAKNLTALSSIQWSGGTESGTGMTITSFDADLVVSGGANKTLDGRLLVVQGQGVETGTGSLAIGNGALFEISGNFDLQSTGSFSLTAGVGTVKVDGEAILMKSNAATVVLPGGIQFYNNGTLQVTGGTLTIQSGGTSQDGTFSAAPGAQISFDSGSPYQLSGNVEFAGGGTINLTGGTLAGAGVSFTLAVGTTFSMQAGSLSGDGNDSFEMDGTFQWSGGSFDASGVNGSILTSTGLSSITGAGSKSINGWTYVTTLGSHGTWDSSSDVNLTAGAHLLVGGQVTASSTFSIFSSDNNLVGLSVLPNGDLEKTGTSELAIAVPVVNQGLIFVQGGGILQFAGTYNQNSGAIGMDVTSTVATTTQLSISDGLVFGSGTISGGLVLNGGRLAPGPQQGGTGTLTVTGSYTQGNSATLEIEADSATPGSGFDHLVVNGGAVISGTLSYTPLAGFAITGTTTLPVLSAQSVSNHFDTYNLPGTVMATTQATAVVLGVAPDPLIVTTTADTVDANDGIVSLREAILYANSNPGTDTITFNIAGVGVHTISPLTALPAITDTVIIDGYSQPGSSKNSLGLSAGDNATIDIVLDGFGAGTADGLLVQAADSKVQGLNIQRFTGAGIRIQAGNVTVAGNFIGTDSVGVDAKGNDVGVTVEGLAASDTIGGTNVADRNLISGNNIGVVIDGQSVTGVGVYGNYIGPDQGGLGNLGDGVQILNGASGNFIGSTANNGGNVISANGGHGISISGDATSNNVVVDNLIGLTSTGFATNGNGQDGVNIAGGATLNIIGGTDPFTANLIGGNGGNGITITDFSTGSNTIEGNIIGTDGSGSQNLHNLGAGIFINNSSNNQIGGIAASAGNVIAFNSQEGVDISGNFAHGDVVLQNLIYGNGVFNLDLGGDERTANDGQFDIDSGPNSLLNFPVLTADLADPGSAVVHGSIDSMGSTTFRVELFSGPAATNGGPEARTFLGFATVTTDEMGHGTFTTTVTGLHSGDFITASATQTGGSSNGTSEFSDAILAPEITPIIITPKTPFTFTDAAGDTVKVKLTGAGTANVVLVGGLTDGADIDTITLVGTNLTSKLEVSMTPAVVHRLLVLGGAGADFAGSDATTTIGHITTTAAEQEMGSIKLDAGVKLGDGTDDSTVDLRVTGKLLSLNLALIAPHTYIKLGEGLPYNVPNDTKTPDTYNNRPTLTVGTVLGPGLLIEVTGDGTPSGVGGGGLGNITFGSWQDAGTIRTTQSIGNFLVKTGNFNGVLEIDKFHVGSLTTADTGSMTIAQGSWGSSGTDVEGNIASFSATDFLAGATITAGSIGMVKTSGDLAGTFILTDPDAPGVPTYTVNSDFVGKIVSAQSIKKLNIKGDFTGSLEAPSIGSITAFSFRGTAGVTDIKATAGPLGLLTTKFGGITDYDIEAATTFTGIKVTLAKLTADTVGIDDVQVKALAIGNISVSLTADAKSTGVDLTGIHHSTFTTTGTGITKTTLGKMGTVTVKLKGASGGNGDAIDSSTFDAQVLLNEFGTNAASTLNTLGNLTVSVAGFGGDSVGLANATFFGDVLGFTHVTVAKGKDLTATSRDVDTTQFTATGNTGYFKFDGDATAAQASELSIEAGGKVGAITSKSKTAVFGSIVDSDILAGQALVIPLPTGTSDKDALAALAKATLGAVALSGGLINSKLVAGASIGAVTIGGDATDSLLLAGAVLGGDTAVGNGNDTFQRVASIASLTVKGALIRTSAVAGIASTNSTFGDADDSIAAAMGTLTGTGSIGAIVLGAGSGTSGPAALAAHNNAIQAAAIKSLKLGTAAAVTDFTTALFFDPAPNEDISDPLVRLLT